MVYFSKCEIERDKLAQMHGMVAFDQPNGFVRFRRIYSCDDFAILFARPRPISVTERAVTSETCLTPAGSINLLVLFLVNVKWFWKTKASIDHAFQILPQRSIFYKWLQYSTIFWTKSWKYSKENLPIRALGSRRQIKSKKKHNESEEKMIHCFLS